MSSAGMGLVSFADMDLLVSLSESLAGFGILFRAWMTRLMTGSSKYWLGLSCAGTGLSPRSVCGWGLPAVLGPYL